MKARIETARLLLYRIAWMKAQKKRLTFEPSEVKLHINESWVLNCQDAIQIQGARGYTVENSIARNLRDAL